ncbi:hypothetical protein AYO44_00885 [Planctomycetaceae bacterium SCGC AG-212-F19]|nr:hypothetical protein AYO44_00885 [Planctomycetaceae bacterium SCGC AG-212-F19]
MIRHRFNLRSRCVLFMVGAAVLLGWLAMAAEMAAQSDRGPYGLEKRVAWTTSKLTGSPEGPPPYRTERVFPQLKFKKPVTLTRRPESDRLFVIELHGAIYSFPDDQSVAKPDLFVNLAEVPGLDETYGLAFHPRFAENRQAFLCYAVKTGDPPGVRLSRVRVGESEPLQVDRNTEEILESWPSGGHNGGSLQFGPDGYLYISTGDGGRAYPADGRKTGQDISDLLASILRIDVDNKGEPEGVSPEKKYRIPPDNPFVKHPGARPEIWAYGLRNPWKMSFDAKTGNLWVGDVGWDTWEMIYRVERGGNYGWSIMEGRRPARRDVKPGPTPILPPTIDHDHSEARCIIGGRVYHGSRLKELQGAYIYGDYVTGKIWGLRFDGTKVTWQQKLAESPLQIIDFGEGRDGELYILDHGGTISRLVPNLSAKVNDRFPTRLSETGLFASVTDQLPAPGVLPYSINAAPWADHGTAERYCAIPGTPRLGVYTQPNFQLGHVSGAWIYPSDTVFAKTIALEMERGNPASRRRFETQVLHRDGATWRAYNYVWNDEQNDAILAGPEGFDKTFTIKDPAAPTGRRQQTWHFASRTECHICHTSRAGSILGFNIPQLNRDHNYGNVVAHQLRTLEHIGLFQKPLPPTLPRIPDPHDTNENLNDRARAYLHANCAHCHRHGGSGTAPFQLLYDLALEKLSLVDTRPAQGSFDLPDARTVAPADPYRSVLYYRMAKLGPGRMPYAGTGVIDEKGLGLIHDWIQALPAAPGRPAVRAASADAQRAALQVLASDAGAAERKAALERLLASANGGMYLMRAIDTRQIAEQVREEVLAVAAAHAETTVRDLFERFIPEEQRVKRLGSVIKPAAILALKGDAELGRKIFFQSSGAQCKSCHCIRGEGGDVGPDLTLIGKKYNPEQLLESILEPSKTIEPAYRTHVVTTKSGALHTGLLVKKTAREIVLKDAQGKIATIPAKDVEEMVTTEKSLMPELLARDMTAQQLADLLQFLASLR